MFVNIFDTDKKYNIIYADSPWKYGGGKGKSFQGLAVNHYKTMTTREIANLPIGNLTEDGVLFLWVTFPHLEDGISVMNKWGFKYRTAAFVWIKLNKRSNTPFLGLGFWTRSNAEICLIGTKGKDYPRRKNNNVSQVIIEPSIRHSQKPDEARKRIVTLMGDIPRIELFARQTVVGWDCWGNEVERCGQREKDLSESYSQITLWNGG